ncbi:MAG: TolC family protein [Flavobacteriaceae bacterium]
MKKYIFLLCLFSIQLSNAQELDSNIMSLQEYLGYVKQFHPIVKQANLIIAESEAKLLKSRGAFDPKLEIDYDKKQFKGSEYYNKFNATFKVPTWYGIELKANFEENTGVFLNPEASVPTDGLYSVGVSLSLARGLLMNQRMSMLKQAKLFKEQAKADRQLLVNQILMESAKAYFDWLKTYNEQLVYRSFLKNAELRFDGVKKSFYAGERASIDTLEAGIIVNNRKLNLEKSKIKYTKSTLQLSNFLWLENNVPIELQEGIVPDINTFETIDMTLNINSFSADTVNIESHPKLISLDRKYESLKIDKRLKANRLLPQVDLEYNFLTQTPELINSLNQNQYKGGIKVKFPLFLRKERGDLKLSKLKLQNTEYEIASTKVSLNNKIKAISQEINSLERQNGYAIQIVNDYQTLLTAEERKFFLGESSIFLVNSRESKLIDSKLKAIDVLNNYLNSKVTLVNTLALMNP